MRDRGIHLRRLFTGLSSLALVLGAAVAAGSAAGASSSWEPPPGAPSVGDQPGVAPAPLPAPSIWPIPTPPPGPHTGPPPGPHTGPPPAPGPHIEPPPGPHVGPVPAPHTRILVLSKRRGTTPFPADRIVTLRCAPPGGTHPSPVSACRLLALVGGNPGVLNVSPWVHCTRIHDPVTVTAVGSWDGRHIAVRHTYPNPCVLRAATGSVYQF
ncbi:SSI family serine proteinase inhibitor [Sphaerisporangium sp. NPDC088356]|uniref:SSI family serine proteinase inhibitor n=1 Tax=Sphaerisporangium sp. NPDC088356 TaxID=3154871 RepID=UPI00342B0FB0